MLRNLLRKLGALIMRGFEELGKSYPADGFYPPF